MNDISQEEKKQKLASALADAGFCFEFIHIKNVAEPLLLIKNYRPTSKGQLLSFVFTLWAYYKNNNRQNMRNKCWLPCSAVKEINNDKPKLHPNYEDFYHNDIKYYAYSVGLGKYSYDDVESLKVLCRNLYEHCRSA